MSDLIRRDDAIESFSKICVTDDLLGMGVQKGLVIAEMRIKDMSAVDAVEVVRCFQCLHRDEDSKICKHPKAIGWDAIEPEDDDFCSYGERRES